MVRITTWRVEFFVRRYKNSRAVAELQARIFVKDHGKGASECANRELRGIALILCVRFRPLPAASETSVFSISSLSSGPVSVFISINFRIAFTKVSCPICIRSVSRSCSCIVLILCLSASHSVSYLWDSSINHSSDTFPVALL